jgi:hypothetical protein
VETRVSLSLLSEDCDEIAEGYRVACGSLASHVAQRSDFGSAVTTQIAEPKATR